MVKTVAAACAVTLVLVACQAPAGGETEPAIVTTAATATAATATAAEQRGSTEARAQPPAVISCTFPDVPAARQLAERMVADRSLIASTTPSTVAFAVYDYATGVTCVRNAAAVFESASIIKVATVAARLWQAEGGGFEMSEEERWLAELAITVSDNDAQQYLWESIGGAPAITDFFSAAGMTATTPSGDDDWGLTQVTAGDQLRLIRHLVEGTLLSRADSDFLLDLMHRVDPEQVWGVNSGAPAGAEVMLKNGWLDDPLPCDEAAEFCDVTWTNNSVGYISSPTASYSMAVLSSGNPSHEDGLALVSAVAAEVAAAVQGR